MKILFVNACMRGKESRTLRICDKFMKKYKSLHPEDIFEEVDITHTDLKPFDAEKAQERIRLTEEGKVDGKMFDLAHQFANADKIIIGAPYWDYSFPSALKIYIEHVSVNTIAYKYTDRGLAGLCKARKMLYITTSGGFMGEFAFGTDYFRGLCNLYGIPQFDSIKGEALDIITFDTEKLLQKAFAEAEALAEKW
ncbi:MAG: NAD(P)H-dependent oxidoreductase [Firmicutes bacterium]|nr:NAD(P)H-dependent oxidoreductase [Bacillota bacterium]